VLQPRIENADDQHGLGRFAPDDEQCVTHDVAFELPTISRLPCPASASIAKERRRVNNNHYYLR
jgi:hypothetical protein